jgi:hypothetical protein
MDALTPAEIFALRRAEQFVALDDLRIAQLARLRHTAPVAEDTRTLHPVAH